ncbi:hypothetical protein NQT66_17625 [Cellulophaga baltica]|uniref:hypothetical protein n=1 Tax=Cellulophaga baltica TaxID=76594 RepID=UPI002148613E|nr:hypothetical protein [Cellulophaga baltica]MCR1026643.1 hypothetical protein [Cellulophaga baltica]
MEPKNKLPENYIPLDELNICSNKLLGGAKIIGIDDFAPILIGDGAIPSIWIFGKNQNNKWVELIKESKSLHPAIQIINDTINREIVIGIQNSIVLKAKMTSNKICEINTIDLRPIGFDIHGKGTEFHIAQSTFSGNTFNLNGFLVGISEKQNAK